MHPKNPYKTPPNFKELALKYPDFRKYALPDLTGKVLIDFKDPAALRALTTSLLHQDFNLEVTIPEDRLVPTLPLRLNYLLWIDDLLQVDPVKVERVRGFDVGTGACCIYPLLGCRLKGWTFLATEIEEVNYRSALENVSRNNLDDSITLKLTDPGAPLLLTNVEGIQYSFCMTNPPFFTCSEEGVPRLSRKNRPEAKFAKLGGSRSSLEVSVEGGEVEFVKKLIDESLQLKDRVRIYTTMLGHKASVCPLKAELKKRGIVNLCQTEFTQGKTTRWGLAWSFCDDIQLRNAPNYQDTKPKPPITYIVEDLTKFEKPTVSCVATKLRECLTNLKMEIKSLKKNKYMEQLEVTARENTWTNLRRKRREAARARETGELGPNPKKLKTDDEPSISEESPREVLVCFHARLQKQGEYIALQLDFVSGTLVRDSLQQILQYLKNHLFK